MLHIRTQPRDDLVRLYAHCLREGAIKGHRGAVLVFIVNLSNDTAVLRPKDAELRTSHTMQYSLAPHGSPGLLADDVQLNGRPLAVNEKLQFPDIVPVVLHPMQGLAVRPHGMSFFVFADYKASACTATF